jgi:uncharacterized membrane protein YoaK (UPF0700 family)
MQRPIPGIVPVLLSFVAGYVDACTFLALFGVFVAHVTGSFVVAVAQLVTHGRGVAVGVLGVPTFFLAGVATTITVKIAERRGRPAISATLALEALLLLGLFASCLMGAPQRPPHAPPVLIASLFGLSAMGVQSAMVRLLIKGAPSTNVMTTNTTQLAIDATELVFAWRARRRRSVDTAVASEYADLKEGLTARYRIMLCFLIGTIVGGVAYVRLNVWCILLGVAIVVALFVWASRWDAVGFPHRDPAGSR